MIERTRTSCTACWRPQVPETIDMVDIIFGSCMRLEDHACCIKPKFYPDPSHLYRRYICSVKDTSALPEKWISVNLISRRCLNLNKQLQTIMLISLSFQALLKFVAPNVADHMRASNSSQLRRLMAGRLGWSS